MGKEGLHHCPFFIGPYKALWSGPSARQNVLIATGKGSSKSGEELRTREESLLVTGERGGGPGVGALCPEPDGGMGMAMDKLGEAEEEQSPSGIGCPSPLQVKQSVRATLP